MEENKPKNNAGLLIIIASLIVVCIGLCGFIFMNRNNLFNTNKSKENKTEEKEKKEEEKKVTFSDSELEKYISYITPVSIGPSAKLYNVSSINVDSLSAREKIEYVGTNVHSKHTSSSDYQYDIISESDVKSMVEEVYGPDTYERTTFNLGCGDYNINESDNKYYSKTGCGGTTVNLDMNTVIDYKATTKKLEITTAYVIYDDAENKIYKDFDKKNAVDDYSNDGAHMDTIKSYLKEYIKNNKDKLNHIVYTFESKDGINYYFTGFVNNK